MTAAFEKWARAKGWDKPRPSSFQKPKKAKPKPPPPDPVRERMIEQARQWKRIEARYHRELSNLMAREPKAAKLVTALEGEKSAAQLIQLGDTDIDVADVIVNAKLYLLAEKDRQLLLRYINRWIDDIQQKAGYSPLEDRLPDFTKPHTVPHSQRIEVRIALQLK